MEDGTGMLCRRTTKSRLENLALGLKIHLRVSYDKLWKKLIDEKMNKRELIHRAKASTNIIAKMGKEEPIALESVAKICAVFHCSVDDILDLDLSTIDYEKGRLQD